MDFLLLQCSLPVMEILPRLGIPEASPPYFKIYNDRRLSLTAGYLRRAPTPVDRALRMRSYASVTSSSVRVRSRDWNSRL